MSRALAGLEPVRSKPVIKWLAEPEPIPEKRPVETSLLDLIAGGHTVIITELDPPKTLDLDRYFKAASHLADAGSDAITLADNSLAILRVSNLAIGAILKQQYNIIPLIVYSVAVVTRTPRTWMPKFHVCNANWPPALAT